MNEKTSGALIYRTFGLTEEASTLDEQSRSVRMIASTAALDSYGDVVEQHWDLSRYNANPAVLFNHNRNWNGSPADDIPVGYSRAHSVKNGQLEFEPVFSDDRASPLAERVWQGIRQKTLRAASVGFRPGAVVKEVTSNGKIIYHLGTSDAPNQLFEISIVPLPANPDAVALSADTDAESPEGKAWIRQRMLFEELARKSQPANPAAEEVTMKDNKTDTAQGTVAETPPADETAQRLADLEARNAELEQQNAESEAELALLRQQRAEQERTARASEIHGLVGKKLTPACEAHALALLEAQPEHTRALLDALPDLHLTEPVVREAPPAARSTESTADQRLAAAARSDLQ
jgi:hypothetical protein